MAPMPAVLGLEKTRKWFGSNTRKNTVERFNHSDLLAALRECGRRLKTDVAATDNRYPFHVV